MFGSIQIASRALLCVAPLLILIAAGDDASAQATRVINPEAGNGDAEGAGQPVALPATPPDLSGDTDGMVPVGVHSGADQELIYLRNSAADVEATGLIRHHIQHYDIEAGYIGSTLITYDTNTGTMYEQALDSDETPLGPVRFGPIDPSRIDLPRHPNQKEPSAEDTALPLPEPPAAEGTPA